MDANAPLTCGKALAVFSPMPAGIIGWALLIAPIAVVLQSKAMAPIALVGMALAVIAYWRATGRVPLPNAAPAWALAALGSWAALSALWAAEPTRAIAGGLGLLARGMLAASAYRAVADEAPPLAPAAWKFLVSLASLGAIGGILLAGFDLVTGHALRAAARGLAEAPAALGFGLKPAASVLALLVPIAILWPPRPLLKRVLQAAALLFMLYVLPSDTAKLAGAAGIATLVIASWAPRFVAGALGLGLGGAILLMPLILGSVLHGRVEAERLPPSAAHRLMIWDFTMQRIAERPLLGWGMEASRTVPGGRDPATPGMLERFGIRSPEYRGFFAAPQTQMLPLHPHNAALQIHLELGLIGAALAAGLVLSLAWAARDKPLASAVMASAAITGMLSFGVWQAWWILAQLLVVVALAAWPGENSPWRGYFRARS